MDMRGADRDSQLQMVISRIISEINTCIPGKIESFDDATQTATVIPAIQAKVTVGDAVSYLDLPQIINVPIVFPFAVGEGFALTLPISAGDPCLLFFSQRAIDNWHMMGGVQPPEQDTPGCRHHSLTDCFAILAPVPLPDVLGSWNSSGIELRNTARTSRVTVEDNQVIVQSGTSVVTVSSTGQIGIVAPVSITVTTPLMTLQGNLEVTGTIKDVTRKMSDDRAIYNLHTHPGDSGGTTGVPNLQE